MGSRTVKSLHLGSCGRTQNKGLFKKDCLQPLQSGRYKDYPKRVRSYALGAAKGPVSAKPAPVVKKKKKKKGKKKTPLSLAPAHPKPPHLLGLTPLGLLSSPFLPQWSCNQPPPPPPHPTLMTLPPMTAALSLDDFSTYFTAGTLQRKRK